MLEELRDIHLPEAVSWWPLAIGWWLLALLTFIACCLIFYYLRKPTLKKQALLILNKIEREYETTQNNAKCLRELSALLRRVAMTKEESCAGLTGEAWLEHLDQGSFEFKEMKELLLSAPYQGKVESDQVPAFMKLCRKWVEAK